MRITLSKSFIYSQVIFWSIILIAAMGFLLIELLKIREREIFEPFVAEYLQKPQNELPSINSLPPGNAAIQGKLVAVNLNESNIDALYNELPEDLKPDTPAQVKTVLWIGCHAETSFLAYTDGSKGIDNVCDLTFIDIVTHEYLWRAKIRVLPPPDRQTGNESAAPDPNDSILNYLAQFPHKN